MTPAWLSDAEVDELCAGLTQHAAKARYLRSLGLTVQIKPNGRPLVVRSHAEAVLSGAPAPMATGTTSQARRSNREALVLAYSRTAA